MADAVAKLIATRDGERPVRTLVGQDVQGILPLNDVAADVQQAFLSQMGMGSPVDGDSAPSEALPIDAAPVPASV